MKSNKTGSTIPNREEIEKRLLDRFPDLSNPQKYHVLFSSFDNHDNEKHMYEFWKELLEYLYENIRGSIGLKFEEIVDFTRIKGKRPLGIENISQKLINEGEFIPSSFLQKDEFYKKYFPETTRANSNSEGWGSWIKKSISSYLWKEKVEPIKSSEVIFNKKLFIHEVEEIAKILENYTIDEDEDVLTLNDLKHILRKNNLDTQYLEYSLTFLEKTLKIEKFKVKVEGVDVPCLKFLNNEHTKVNLKDNAIITHNLLIKSLEKKISELYNTIQDSVARAKEMLLKKDRQSASTIMKRKIIFSKAYEHYLNLKTSLEQNLIDIKTMESNQNLQNVLIMSSKVTESLKLNLNEFENITDKVKDNAESLKDLNGIINDFNGDINNDADLEKELADLQESERKKENIVVAEPVINQNLSKIFPKVGQKEVIKQNDIANDFIINNDEVNDNFMNKNDSFQNILEELNGKK